MDDNRETNARGAPEAGKTPKLVLFTDLDGTFLDGRTYSFDESLPASREAKHRGVPVVYVSSKTRAEIEEIRAATGVGDPFIVENGGAVYVPMGYFPFEIDRSTRRDGYDVIELGVPYQRLVAALDDIRERLDLPLVGFSDLTEEEVAALTGLPPSTAALAKRREWDEPF
jgi:mannosyl-3-phosphoglycerate phosphatase